MTILGLGGVKDFVKSIVGDSVSETIDRVKEDAEIVAVAREKIEKVRAEIELVPRRYEIKIPSQQGSFSWRTDVETAEYSVAIIAGSYIYGFECDFRTVGKEIYMDPSDRKWRLIVNKTSGCDRLRVDVVYVPSTWIADIRFSEPGEALERMLDRY